MSGKDDKKKKLNTKQTTGHIKAIPLSVQDKDTKKLIKVSTLFVHSIGEESKGTTQSFGNIYVTAVHQEGRFHSVITKENCFHLRKRGDFSTEEWESKIAALFPRTVSFEQNGNEAKDLQLSAKLFSLEEYYDSQTRELIDTEDMLSLSDYITIDIKTRDQLPVTLGSLDLFYADESDKLGSNELLQNELDLFLWLGILSQERDMAITRLAEAEEKIESLNKQNNFYKKEVEDSSRSHRELVVDLQDKFFQLLNAKKDKIWHLQMNNRLKGSLPTSDVHVKQENELTVENFLGNTTLEEKKPPIKRRRENRHDEDVLSTATMSHVYEAHPNSLGNSHGHTQNDTHNQLDQDMPPSDMTRHFQDEPDNRVLRSQIPHNAEEGPTPVASDTEISSDESSTGPVPAESYKNDDVSDQSTNYSGEDDNTDADSSMSPKTTATTSAALKLPEMSSNNHTLSLIHI